MELEEFLTHSRLKGKRITLCVTGGIAAYKAVEILRIFQKSGAEVRVIMSKMATRFIGEETFSALTGRKTIVDFEGMEHINIPHSSDLIVVAPATANTIAKFANGICDSFLTTVLISATCPIVFVPSMNWSMLKNPVTVENIEKIRKIGHFVVQPDEGELACGETGEGRFPSYDKILFHCEKALASKRLYGKKVVVTAGPTREYIDEIRFISNPSSGFMGYVLAWEAAIEGAETHLITGGQTFGAEGLFDVKRIESAEDMLRETLGLVPVDIFVGSAAVSDFKPSERVKGKIKKEGVQKLVIELTKNPDIVEKVRNHTRLLIGFALEAENFEENAKNKMISKRMDMIVGNSPESFANPYGHYFIIYRDRDEVKMEKLGKIHKRELARKIIDKICHMLSDDKFEKEPKTS